MTTPESQSLPLPEGSLPPSGLEEDPIVEEMRFLGRPIDRETYLGLAYPEGAPDPMPAELELQLPEELRLKA